MRRLERGALAPSPGATSETAETPAPPGSVRLAVGGHPACLDRCGGAGGQGYAPDTHLQSAIARVRAMAAGGAGPAALLIGGGRASLGGEPLDPGGARRYRELTQGAGVPTYVLPGPGDLPNGGAEAFASAFATAPAPQGTGEAPAGVDLLTVTQPEAAVAGQARSTFAFDVQAPAGTVRVIAIDNAAGRLAGGPDGAQAQWIRETMEQARLAGFPSIVVGSIPLDDSQNAKPAEDADEEIALLAGHASAYVATAGVDDPADQLLRRRAGAERRPGARRRRPAHAAPVLDARLRAFPEVHGRPRRRGSHPPDERRAADDRRRRRPLGPDHRGRARRRRVRAAPAGPGARSRARGRSRSAGRFRSSSRPATPARGAF